LRRLRRLRVALQVRQRRLPLYSGVRGRPLSKFMPLRRGVRHATWGFGWQRVYVQRALHPRRRCGARQLPSWHDLRDRLPVTA
jgi:hypothetical protein